MASSIESEKLQAVAIEAAEQSERLDVPVLEPVRDFEEVWCPPTTLTSAPSSIMRALQVLMRWIAADTAAESPEDSEGPPGSGGRRPTNAILICEERSEHTVPLLEALGHAFPVEGARGRVTTAGGDGDESGNPLDRHPRRIAFAVGPEGGWAPGEVQSALDRVCEDCKDATGATALDERDGSDLCVELQGPRATLCIYRVSLGESILRAETAAMYVRLPSGTAVCGSCPSASVFLCNAYLRHLLPGQVCTRILECLPFAAIQRSLCKTKPMRALGKVAGKSTVLE